MDAAFDVLLDRLYAVFATPTPPEIFGCPCCLSGKQTDILLAKPLRHLTADDLGRYAGSVFLTVGGARDFGYLLPRILEIAARDPTWWPSSEITIGKLRLAEWKDWDNVERRAVVDILSAWFDAVAEGSSPETDDWPFGAIEGLVCGLARADLDIAPYLDRLLLPKNAKGLANLLQDYRTLYSDRDLLDGFWADAPEAAKLFEDFVAEHA